MRGTGPTWAALAVTLALAAAAQAAPPPEPVEVRVVEVDVAGREIVAGGVTWALESTARINVPGKRNGSLRDVTPGMQVQLTFAPSDNPEPAVRSVTVLPD